MPGVYISYPFCAQKCTYCNFASGVFPRELEPKYLTALEAEIDRHAWTWTPGTVYLGGGTPSQIEPDALARLLARVPGRPWREATMEAAPGSLTPEKIAAWRDAGITRVSLGVQSFVRGEIARTGRRHTAEIVAREVDWLRHAGIAEINIDLIAGLAGQTAASWAESLDWVDRIGAPHVSVYMLEVDEDSRLGKELLLGGVRYGAGDVPDDAETAAMYETAACRLAARGIARYEISNFARPGHESAHNLKYWRLDPYIGFGADAHSFDAGRRWRNAESVDDYLEQTARIDDTAADPRERLWVGLRLTEGVPLTAADLDRHAAAIARFTDAGLVDLSAGRLRLTPRGVLLSNEVFQEFLTS